MELALIAVEKIIEMFLIMLAGMAAWRLGILDSSANKKLSGFLLNFIMPAMILSSYQMDFQEELLQGLLLTAVFSAASFGLAILLSSLALGGKGNKDLEIEQMSVIYSNCGFMGIPLINGLAGQEGVFFMTAYITIFNLLVWSHGLALMCGTGSWKTALKKFVQPSTIAVFTGLVLFLCRIRLPQIILEPLASVGDMNTPMAMVIAGVSLSESHLLRALTKPRTYWICFLKLAAVPALTLVLMFCLGLDGIPALAVLIGAACPTAAMGTMFALQYHKNSSYAAELFAVTTVLSLISIPCMVLAGSRIF